MKKKSLNISYIILSSIGIILLVFWIYYLGKNNWVENLSLNLFTEVLGILLVVFLIDSIIKKNKENEKKKYEQISLNQLYFPIKHHLDFLFNLYKATVDRKPDEKIVEVKDFFNDNYFESIRHLDFTKEAPVIHNIQYYLYCFEETNRFKESISLTISSYSFHLSTKTLELLNKLLSSKFFFLMMSMKKVEELFPDKKISGDFSLFSNNGIIEIIKEYTNILIELVEVFNSASDNDKRIIINTNSWSNSIAPQIGSGRI